MERKYVLLLMLILLTLPMVAHTQPQCTSWTDVDDGMTIDSNGCYRLTDNINTLYIYHGNSEQGDVVLDMQGYSINKLYVYPVGGQYDVDVHVYNGTISHILSPVQVMNETADHFSLDISDINTSDGVLVCGEFKASNVRANGLRVFATEYNIINSTFDYDVVDTDTNTILHAIGILLQSDTTLGDGNYVVIIPRNEEYNLTLGSGRYFLTYYYSGSVRIVGDVPDVIRVLTNVLSYGNVNLYLNPSTNKDVVRLIRYYTTSPENIWDSTPLKITADDISKVYENSVTTSETVHLFTKNINRVIVDQGTVASIKNEGTAYVSVKSYYLIGGGDVNSVEFNKLIYGTLIVRDELNMDGASIEDATIRGTDGTIVNARKISIRNDGATLLDLPLEDNLDIYGAGPLTIAGSTPSEKIFTHSKYIHVNDLTTPEMNCQTYYQIDYYNHTITSPGCYVVRDVNDAPSEIASIEIRSKDVYLDLNRHVVDKVYYDVNVPGDIYIEHGTVKGFVPTGNIHDIEVNLHIYDVKGIGRGTDVESYFIVANRLDIDHGSELSTLLLYNSIYMGGTVNYTITFSGPSPLNIGECFRDCIDFLNVSNADLTGQEYNVVYLPMSDNITIRNPLRAIYLIPGKDGNPVLFKLTGSLPDTVAPTIISRTGIVPSTLYLTVRPDSFTDLLNMNIKQTQYNRSTNGNVSTWSYEGSVYIKDDSHNIGALYFVPGYYDISYNIFDQSSEVISKVGVETILPKRLDIDELYETYASVVTDQNSLAVYKIHRRLHAFNMDTGGGGEIDIYLDPSTIIDTSELQFSFTDTVKIWNLNPENNLTINCDYGYEDRNTDVYLYGVGDPNKIEFTGKCVPHIYLHGGIRVERYVEGGNLIKIIPSFSGGLTLNITPGYTFTVNAEENTPVYLVAAKTGKVTVTYNT